MHFTKLIKSSGYQPVTQPQQQTADSSELLALLRKLSDDNTKMQIPNVLAETILNDDEVDDILGYILQFRDEYFPNIPLSPDIVKQFLWNAPRDIVRGMRNAQTHPDQPDILNPVMFLYPLLMQDPYGAIGLYWNTMLEILESNRDAIRDDAAAYVADLNFDANADLDDESDSDEDYEVVAINPAQEDGDIPYDE